MTVTALAPSHPGEILAEDLDDAGISQRQLASAILVPHTRISEICRGVRPITANTALRLARYFGTSPEYWMNLQVRYDLDMAADATQDEIAAIVPRDIDDGRPDEPGPDARTGSDPENARDSAKTGRYVSKTKASARSVARRVSREGSRRIG